MRYEDMINELQAGRTVAHKPHGNSMTPIITSGQRIEISPCEPSDIQTGDVVLAKVKGRCMIHKVTRISMDGRFMISNNHGHDNGWSRQIYGKVTKIG
jgi:phage repressor protein C with HTH and peptisase S24 domain